MAMGAEQGGGAPAVQGLSGNSAFGKYQLFASLGRGGMADVFLAVARGPMGFNKLAVVKRLRAQLADDPSFRTMFLDEARLAARLNHPNVVHTYEVGEQDGVYFIAMEYLEGQPLNKIIHEAVKTNKVFEESFCARVVSDALSGLNHAHELKDYDGKPLQIIHRDVSPHNVFVTYGGVVKLVDFGIAKAALSSTETEVGVLKGKVAYMSPEQAMAGPIDQRSDLFAMGIVLWELLTRQRLMTGDSAAATLHRLLNSAIPAVSSVRTDIDPELDAIVAKALEKDPKYRFQTAIEMRDALEGYLSSSSSKAMRAEEVGHSISLMFTKMREEVQKQIQVHMEKVAATPMNEPVPVSGGLGVPRQLSGGTQGALPHLLGVSGSGSGIVPSFGTGASIPPRDVTGAFAPPQPEKKSPIVLIVIAAFLGLLLLAVLGLVFQGLKSKPGNGAVVTTQATDTPPAIASTVTTGTPIGIQGTTTGVPSGVIAPGTVTAPTATATSTATAATASTTSTHTGHQTGHGTRPSTTATAQPTAVASPSEEGGFLTLDTYPWTKVSEGGKVYGNTPLVHFALSAGSHTLTLENPDQGLKQTTTITIKAGETVTKRLGLQ